MSEIENQVEETEDGAITNPNSEVEEKGAEVSPSEQRARDAGWRPLEEWEGDEEDWVDYKQFNLKGELYDRIKSQTGQIRNQDQRIEELNSAIKQFAEHNKKVAKIEYERALRDLQAQRRQAFEEQDYEQLTQVDEDLKELESLNPENTQNQVPDQVTQTPNQPYMPELEAWQRKNDWFAKDKVLQAAALAIGQQYIMQHPEAKTNPQLVLEHMEKEIKKKFPSEFPNARRTAVSEGSAERGGNKQPNRKHRFTVRDLTPDQKKFGQFFVDSEAGTMQDYVDQLVELGELG